MADSQGGLISDGGRVMGETEGLEKRKSRSVPQNPKATESVTDVGSFIHMSFIQQQLMRASGASGVPVPYC